MSRRRQPNIGESIDPSNSTGRPLLSWTGLAGAAGWMVCLFTLLGFAGRWSWLFELTSHFRAQYAVILLGLAALFLWRRDFRTSSVFISMGLLNGCLIAPFLWGAPAHAHTDDHGRIRLLSWNMLRGNQNLAEVSRLIEEQAPDILLLLEVDLVAGSHLEATLTNFPHRMLEAREDNFGIACFSRLPLERLRVIRVGKADLPSIEAHFHAGEGLVSFLGTHPLPPVGAVRARYRNQQLAEVARWVTRQTNAVIVAGDLNVTPWSPVFADLLKESGLANSSQGRGLNGGWPAWFPPLLIPIDHCLATEGVTVTSVKTLKAKGSDHRARLVEFSVR